MNRDIAIKVDNVSKIFQIPHETRNTIRERIINFRTKMTYETFEAIKDISFEVRKGEFFGIIGRNGSGKSTLLKMLAGIYNPDCGSVFVNGEISPFLELGVGFNPELSGKDNIYLNATILGLSKKEIENSYDKIVEFSELERFIHLKLKNYSSGMQVRLAFSVSIHANKDILLMDEVLAVGDTNFQAKCLSEFIRFRESGKTVVLVTHDTGTVQRYCDRAMLLGNGGFFRLGQSDEIVSAYIDRNMSDEERRLKEIAEKKPEAPAIQESEKHYKEIQPEIIEGNIETGEKKKVSITALRLFDRKGEMKNVFATGEDLLVKVYFTVNDNELSGLNFGLSLYSQESLHISGITTIIDKIDTRQYKTQGYFEVKYPGLQLSSNYYYFKAGVFGENENKILDFMHRSGEFQVVSRSLNPGLFQINYAWG